MAKKHPDIYIGQIDSYGWVYTLQRVTCPKTGFVYYAPKRMLLKYPISNGKERRVRTLKEAREVRREWIAKQKAEGKTVKGTTYIDYKMIQELNVDRFEHPVLIQTMYAVGRTYNQNNGYILLTANWITQDVVYGAEFGLQTIGTIERAIDNKGIFEVFPRKDAPQI